MTGEVVSWGTAGPFGKIWSHDRKAFFAHIDDLTDVVTLTPGQRVEFEPVETPRGPRAIDVRPLGARVS